VVGIRASEDVIGDIGAMIRPIIRPLNRGRQAANVPNLLARELAAGIYVALHRVLVALPGPCGAEGDAGSGWTVVVCALRARCRGADAPQVVQEFVPVDRLVSIL